MAVTRIKISSESNVVGFRTTFMPFRKVICVMVPGGALQKAGEMIRNRLTANAAKILKDMITIIKIIIIQRIILQLYCKDYIKNKYFLLNFGGLKGGGQLTEWTEWTKWTNWT